MPGWAERLKNKPYYEGGFIVDVTAAFKGDAESRRMLAGLALCIPGAVVAAIYLPVASFRTYRRWRRTPLDYPPAGLRSA